jgi:hypothetical protein
MHTVGAALVQAFLKHPTRNGFQAKPTYDTCVANKMENGEQCTIVWYVDDMKISHVDSEVVTRVIESIKKKFEKMTVTRGKEHVFLGLNISFNDKDGTANIKMKDYIKEAIAEFGEDITRTTTTPAKRNLFEIDETSEALPDPEREIFHSIVAKLLYVSVRGRMNIQLAIAFLCTRVLCKKRQVEVEANIGIPIWITGRVRHNWS